MSLTPHTRLYRPSPPPSPPPLPPLGPCVLDFLRASSETSYQDEYVNGGDGTLVAEFRAMEYFHRLAIEENSYSNSEESFACSVLSTHYMACLDVAGPGTFTGDSSSPALDWDMKADEVNYRNVSVLVNQNLTNLFGIGCGSSSFSTVENTGRHGDGVINSLDIGVLVFAMFRDAPYDKIGPENGEPFDQVLTVDQRPETQGRCRDGRSRSDWQVELGDMDYCPPNLDYGSNFSTSFRRLEAPTSNLRRLAEPTVSDSHIEAGGSLQVAGADAQVALVTNSSLHKPDFGFVRSRFRGMNNMGSWHSFEFAPNIVPVMVELLVHGIWSGATAMLSNAPPPRDGSEVPVRPDRYQVRWSRTEQQEAFAIDSPQYDPWVPQHLQTCKNIVPGTSGTQVIIGDTLTVRQEGVGAYCPFLLHLWVPAEASEVSEVEMGRALAETPDVMFVWAKRGSVTMTTTGGYTLNPGNAYEGEASPPPPPLPPSPPSPPMAPLPPVAPPPADPPNQYRQLDVEQTFNARGEEANYVVDELKAQEEKLKQTVRTYVKKLTDTPFSISTSASKDVDESSSGDTATARAVALPSPTGAPADAESADSILKTIESQTAAVGSSRLLSEASSGDTAFGETASGCAQSATLKIIIRFEDVVTEDTLQQMENDWPDILQDTTLTPCADPTFVYQKDITTEQKKEDEVDVIMAVIVATSAFVICVFCCTVWAFAIRRSRNDEDKEKDRGRRNPGRSPVVAPLLTAPVQENVSLFRMNLNDLTKRPARSPARPRPNTMGRVYLRN